MSGHVHVYTIIDTSPKRQIRNHHLQSFLTLIRKKKINGAPGFSSIHSLNSLRRACGFLDVITQRGAER